MSEKEKKSVAYDTVGHLEGTYFGNPGYRRGLLLQAKARFKENDVDFVILEGGLINKNDVKKKIRAIRIEEQKAYESAVKKLKALKARLTPLIKELKDKLKEEKNEEKVKALATKLTESAVQIENQEAAVESSKPRKPKEISEALEKELLEEIVEDLPEFEKADGTKIKLYIVTSSAIDGEIGRRIAWRLTERRKDVVFYGENRSRVNLQKCGKKIVVLVPEKAVWRTEYYSSYPDRLVNDDRKRTSHESPQQYVIGGFGSSLNRGKGANHYERISVPTCHKPEDNSMMGNMVGVRVSRYYSDDRPSETKTYDFKHLTTKEWALVKPPQKCSATQKRIIGCLSEHGPQSVGELEHQLGISRDLLKKALRGLLNRPRAKAGLVFNEESRKYSFNPQWLQKILQYNWPDKNDASWLTHTVIFYSCIHGGSLQTAYRYVMDVLHRTLVDWGVDVVFNCGDTIEGLKHALAQKGETLRGYNYTKQENLAAFINAIALLRAFRMRLEKALKDKNAKTQSTQDVENLVRALLPTYIRIWGNHDEWQAELGFTPDAHFDLRLEILLRDGLANILKEKGLPNVDVKRLVKEKFLKYTEDDVFTFPSGITMSGIHYHAGNTQTTSIWPQRALAQFNSHILGVGNFHATEHVEEFNPEFGLRVSVKLPTLKVGTNFEKKKGKTTDFGVGLVKVRAHKGKILESEGGFLGKKEKQPFSYNELESWCKEAGLAPEDSGLSKKDLEMITE